MKNISATDNLSKYLSDSDKNSFQAINKNCVRNPFIYIVKMINSNKSNMTPRQQPSLQDFDGKNFIYDINNLGKLFEFFKRIKTIFFLFNTLLDVDYLDNNNYTTQKILCPFKAAFATILDLAFNENIKVSFLFYKY